LQNDLDELCDLEKDPGEMNDIINDPKYDQVEQELQPELEKQKIQHKYNPDRDWWLRAQIPVTETKKITSKSKDYLLDLVCLANH